MGSISPGETVGILALHGDLDFSIKDSIERAFAPLEDVDVAILSCSDVTFCDSTILSATIRLQKQMRAAGRLGEVVIVGAHSSFRRVLDLCHFDRIFTICDSMETATERLTPVATVVHMGTVTGEVMTNGLELHPSSKVGHLPIWGGASFTQ